jgi:hypothetical protein
MSTYAKTLNLTTFSNDSSAGAVAWDVPGNAAVSDDVYAKTVSSDTTNGSYWLKGVLNAATHISPDAVIVGITFNAEYASIALDKVMYASLVKANAPAGSVYNQLTTATEITYAFGGASDLWGISILANDINQLASFGAAFRVAHAAAIGVALDYMNMIVHHQPGNIMMAM